MKRNATIKKCLAFISISLFLLTTALSLINCGGGGEGSSSPPTTPTTNNEPSTSILVSQNIGQTGGVIKVSSSNPNLNNISVSIPDGALSSNTLIGVSQDTCPAPFDTYTKSCIKLSPEGTTFNKLITLTLPYDPVQYPDASEIRLVNYDPNGYGWDELTDATVDVSKHTISGSVSHFSLFGIEQKGDFFNHSMYKNNRTGGISANVSLKWGIDSMPIPSSWFNANGWPGAVATNCFFVGCYFKKMNGGSPRFVYMVNLYKEKDYFWLSDQKISNRVISIVSTESLTGHGTTSYQMRISGENGLVLFESPDYELDPNIYIQNKGILLDFFCNGQPCKPEIGKNYYIVTKLAMVTNDVCETDLLSGKNCVGLGQMHLLRDVLISTSDKFDSSKFPDTSTIDADGNSIYDDLQPYYTKPGSSSIPSSPTNFVVTAASSSQINLSWNASAGMVTWYKIYRDGSYLKAVAGTSTSDKELSASTNHCYYVTAYNNDSASESAQTGQQCATTYATIAPSPVINPISNGSVTTGTPYTGPTPSLSQGASPITWSLVNSPSGMTINSSTGVVSWANPTTGGSPYTVTIQAQNSAGSNTATWQLTVTEASALEAGLLAYWKFDGNGNDTAAGGRNLVVSGASYVNGIFGQALSLTGTANSYAQQSQNDTVFDFASGSFTMQAWVNYNDTSNQQVLIEKFSNQTGPGWTLTALLDTHKYQFYWKGYPLNTSVPVGGITAGVWHHVVVVHNPSRVEIFFDGQSIGSAAQTPREASTNPLLIGRRTSEDRDGPFATNGLIDEMAIWNRALTPAEVTSLWNSGRGNPIF